MVIIISYKRKNKLGKQRQIQWKRLNATSDVKKKTELNTNIHKPLPDDPRINKHIPINVHDIASMFFLKKKNES